MANAVRGFCEVKIGESTYEVSLCMGALAEIETEFGVESFEDALNFGDKVSATKLRKMVRAVLKGNGVDLSPEMLRQIDRWSPAEFMDLVTRLLTASGLAKEADGEPAPEGDAAPLGDATAGETG